MITAATSPQRGEKKLAPGFSPGNHTQKASPVTAERHAITDAEIIDFIANYVVCVATLPTRSQTTHRVEVTCEDQDGIHNGVFTRSGKTIPAAFRAAIRAAIRQPQPAA